MQRTMSRMYCLRTQALAEGIKQYFPLRQHFRYLYQGSLTAHKETCVVCSSITRKFVRVRHIHVAGQHRHVAAVTSSRLGCENIDTSLEYESPAYWNAACAEFRRQIETGVTITESDKECWDDVTFLREYDNERQYAIRKDELALAFRKLDTFPGYPEIARWIRDTTGGLKNGRMFHEQRDDLHLWVHFQSEEECKVAEKKLHNATYDGHLVELVTSAREKRKNVLDVYEVDFSGTEDKVHLRRKFYEKLLVKLYPDFDVSALPGRERIALQLGIYRRFPYSWQLEKKTEHGLRVLSQLTEGLLDGGAPDWLPGQMEENNGLPAKLLDIIPAPIRYQYRNKATFLIGKDIDGLLKVGFVEFCTEEADPTEITVYSRTACTTHQQVANSSIAAIEDCLRLSPWTRVRLTSTRGGFNSVVIRTSPFGDCAAIINVKVGKDHLQPEKIEKEAVRIGKYFTEGPGKDCGLTAAFLLLNRNITTGICYPDGYYHCFGKPFVWEKLLGLTLRVSMNVFFQSNVRSTEQLYTIVHEFLRPSKDTIFIDAGCGTGAVGLSNSKFCKKVYGIDSSEQAIRDARFNARLNGMNNVEYIQGKVESVLPELLSACSDGDDVVATLDPNRPGFQCEEFLHKLRQMRALKRIVFIACRFDISYVDVVSLCKRLPGFEPDLGFRPVRFVIMDMFPQSRDTEWAMLLERTSPSSD